MIRNLVTFGIVGLMLAGVTTFNYYQNRPAISAAQEQQQALADAKVKEAEDREAEMEKMRTARASRQDAKTQATPIEDVPDIFTLEFKCSNGTFVAEFHKEWAPIGVAHLWDLVQDNYYDEARFFRVIPGFMVQFGLAADPMKTAKWSTDIKDDPVKQKNTRGMITYAKTNSPNSRSTQLYINYGNNTNLDGMGFAPIGRVLTGMDVVDGIFSGHREGPSQGLITQSGNEYLNDKFPKLDYIEKLTLLENGATSSGDADTDEAKSEGATHVDPHAGHNHGPGDHAH